MTALLGLLAIAGYQNRDKLFKMLGDLGKPGAAGPDGIGGLLGQLRKNLGETNPGRVLNRRLGPRCWTPWRNKRVYRKTICSADCLARFQTPSIATPRKADSPLTKGSFDFSKRAVRNERTTP